MIRVAIVVPEYRTSVYGGGGLAAVADFVVDAIRDDPDVEGEIVSPRMWHRAPESRRLLAPSTWLRGLSVQCRSSIVPVRYVGSNLAEFEFMRYQPRRILTEVLNSFDVVIVIAGVPAFFEVARRIRRPTIGQVATIVKEERSMLLSRLPWRRRALLWLNTQITARFDTHGVGVPDVVLVENDFMARWTSKHSAKDVRLVIPGVDVELFRPGGQPADRRVPAAYVLSVGRFDDPRKDVHSLVRAYAHAVTHLGLTHRLVLAGRAIPTDSVGDLAASLGVEGLLDMHVGPDSAELVSLYQGADAFVSTSAEEGLGIAMMEALSCGLPVLSTANRGAIRLLEGGPCGRLIPFGPNLLPMFASALVDFLRDERARVSAGAAARELAVTRLSTAVQGPIFLSIAKELISSEPVGDAVESV